MFFNANDFFKCKRKLSNYQIGEGEGGGEREIERERERERDRQTDRQTDKQTEGEGKRKIG